MSSRRFQAEGVNADTGEIIDITGQLDQTTGRRHAKKERRHQMFTLVDPTYMQRLVLTQQEAKVFWIIVSSLTKGSGSLARIGTGEIVEKTGMLKSNVSTTLASLKSRQIIARERVGVWAINPWLMYAGSAEEWETATEKHPQPEWSRP